MPNVSRREDSWNTRLQQERIAIERPGVRVSLAEQIHRVASRADVAPTEWTGDGKIRHPSLQGFRADKSPTDVRRERAE